MRIPPARTSFLAMVLILTTSVTWNTALGQEEQETAVESIANRGNGVVDVVCKSGRKAVATLRGTVISVDLTEPDGSKSGMSIMPSGGSADPAVAIGDGKSLAEEICS